MEFLQSIEESKLFNLITSQEKKSTILECAKFVNHIWTDFDKLIRHYTDHALNHSLRILSYIEQFKYIVKRGNLKEDEIYALLMGVLLHDIGMQCDLRQRSNVKKLAISKYKALIKEKYAPNSELSEKEQEELRQNHHLLTATWLSVAYVSNDSTDGLNSIVRNMRANMVEDIIDICRFHTNLDIYECEEKFKNDHNSSNKRFIAAILRLGDELDIAHNRANIDDRNNFFIPDENGIHWYLHNNTQVEIINQLENKHLIEIRVYLRPEDHSEYRGLLSYSYGNLIKKNEHLLLIIKNKFAVDFSAPLFVGIDLAAPLPRKMMKKYAHSANSEIQKKIESNLLELKKINETLYNNRRYIFNVNLYCETEQYDVVIVGSGIAGLYVAHNLDPRLKCVIITKGNKTNDNDSSSMYSQGGITAVRSNDDSYDQFIEDTIIAGSVLSNEDAVKVLAEEGSENIERLIKEIGVVFDTTLEGLVLTKGGGHTKPRIIHCNGDATGKEITNKLYQIVEKNVKIYNSTFLVDIITDDKKNVAGIIALDATGKQLIIRSSNVILATGGLGQIYKYTTNPQSITGDGIACAYRAGAEVSNMGRQQFHPTVFFSDNADDKQFLISEVVRGEGGILRNKDDKAIMQGVHPQADLAPRGIVAREIQKYINNGERHVKLDVSKMTEEFFRKRFPMIFDNCRKYKINVPVDCIPVRPTQHYCIGGVKTDLDGQTRKIKGLFVVGEAAYTGVHGADRLIGNSLLECIVFARRCALYINKNFIPPPNDVPCIDSKEYDEVLSEEQCMNMRDEIKNIMDENVGVVRKIANLESAKEKLYNVFLKLDVTNFGNDIAKMQLYNMAQLSIIIIEDEINRKRNIETHYM